MMLLRYSDDASIDVRHHSADRSDHGHLHCFGSVMNHRTSLSGAIRDALRFLLLSGRERLGRQSLLAITGVVTTVYGDVMKPFDHAMPLGVLTSVVAGATGIVRDRGVRKIESAHLAAARSAATTAPSGSFTGPGGAESRPRRAGRDLLRALSGDLGRRAGLSGPIARR
jgi:hypothetical protein